MQSKQSTLIQVGLFVVVTLVIAMISIFFVGKKQSFFERLYTVRVHFTDISGLRRGASVQLAGVGVGFVESVRFPEETQSPGVDVVLKINRNFKDRIREDSVASIQTQGLLGDKFVYITPGSASFKAVLGGGLLQSEVKVGLGTLVQEAGGTFRDLGEAARSFRKIADQIALDSQDKNRISLILDNLDAASRDLKIVMNRIASGEGTVGALIQDRALYNDMRSLMGRADRSKLLKKLVRATLEEQEKGSSP